MLLDDNDFPELLGPIPEPDKPAWVGRSEKLLVQAEALAGAREGAPFRFSFFMNDADPVRLVAQVDNVINPQPTSTIVSGTVSAAGSSVPPAGEFTLSIVENELIGRITIQDTLYKLETVSEDVVKVTQIDRNGFPDEAESIEPGESPDTGNDNGRTCDDYHVPSQPASLRILLLFTDDVRKKLGSDAKSLAFANDCINSLNQSCKNSDVKLSADLASGEEFPGWATVSYEESGNSSTDLTRLQSGKAFVAARKLRMTHRADIMSLIVSKLTDGSAGVGYIMSRFNTNFAPWACNVVLFDAAVDNLSFAHEVAHNMGANHVADPGICNYSVGARFKDGNIQYRTVMAYAPGTRVAYFSGPKVKYDGRIVTGSKDADNARTINNTCEIVAGFKEFIQDL